MSTRAVGRTYDANELPDTAARDRVPGPTGGRSAGGDWWMSDIEDSGSDQIPEWAIICSACGEAHHYDARGTQCNACGAFLPEATEEQHEAFTEWYVERCESYERGDLELRTDGGTSVREQSNCPENHREWRESHLAAYCPTCGADLQSPESEQAGEYDGEVQEIPFDRARQMLDGEADELMAVAREQLWENYQKKGDGWQFEVPRFHFWKGIDEFYSACHAVKQGDIDTMERRIADGWNHILMASYLSYSQDEGPSNGQHQDTDSDHGDDDA